MARYFLVRLVGIVGVLIAVSIITFGMMHAVPGGPFDVYADQQIPLPEYIQENLNAKYHLDEPIYVQYLSYMAMCCAATLARRFVSANLCQTLYNAAGRLR